MIDTIQRTLLLAVDERQSSSIRSGPALTEGVIDLFVALDRRAPIVGGRIEGVLELLYQDAHAGVPVVEESLHVGCERVRLPHLLDVVVAAALVVPLFLGYETGVEQPGNRPIGGRPITTDAVSDVVNRQRLVRSYQQPEYCSIEVFEPVNALEEVDTLQFAV